MYIAKNYWISMKYKKKKNCIRKTQPVVLFIWFNNSIKINIDNAYSKTIVHNQ